MDPVVSPVLDRKALSHMHIRGSGIEIGALHYPLPVAPDVSVRYVDRMSVDGLREQYPELAEYSLVPVDIVDDGEILSGIADGSQDFVIANHFLEHCEDPIQALLNFFRVLRSGGVLYMAIPDKRFTFDRNRPVTPLEHLINDHQFGPQISREDHFREYVHFVDNAQGPDGEEALYQERIAKNSSIHFHVWTSTEMFDLFQYMRSMISYETLCFQENGMECIFIMRKIS